MLCTTSAGFRRRGKVVAPRAAKRRRRPVGVAVAVVVLAVSVVACSDADSGRRFANDPMATLPPPTPSATVDPSSRPSPPLVWGGVTFDPATAGALVDTRGAPKRIYFTSGGELWTVDSDGSNASRLYAPGAGETIRAVASAPGVAAGEVALLLADAGGPVASPAASPAPEGEGDESPGKSAAPPSTSLLILAADGSESRTIDRLESTLSEGDPASLPEATALSWSPQGGVLLATFAPGGIVAVPRGGDPMPLPLDGVGQPIAASWSPAGDAIAVIGLDETTGRGRLSVVPAGIDATQAVPVSVAPAAESSAGVINAAWLPDGSSLLYTEATAGAFAGGDLYRVSRDGSDRELVASAGRAAPVAQVAEFAIAPDGSAVAYTVAIPDPAGGLQFHSLWVQSLKDRASVRVPIAFDLAVAQLWWTDSGLVWRAVEGDFAMPPTVESFALQRMNDTGEIAVLFTHAPPAATPGASPIAESVASPAASPAAAATTTPEGNASPQASPVAPIRPRSPFGMRS